MSEKESKLIKLVLAIKRSGVDIEKIYNEEVLNEESDDNSHNIANSINSILFVDRGSDADNSGIFYIKSCE